MRRPRVAAIVTEYRLSSHADAIVTKLLEGYELFWTALRPRIDVAALYTDQVPTNDLSREVAARHGVTIFPTIREALTLGTSALAVDGVLLIGEHGDYPLNEKGQKLYPRRRFFEETAAVFRESGRAVPVYSDKHLAWNWSDAKWMYDTARALGVPFMAGSTLPLALRRPPVQVPLDANVEEIVAVAHGRLEGYGYHALEMAQCLAERRRGGETGVTAVQCLSGEAFWTAWDSGDRWSSDLQAAALAAVAHEDGPPRDYYARRAAAGIAEGGQPAAGPARSAEPPHSLSEMPEGAETAFLVEYADGLRVAILMLNGYAKEFGVAVRVHGTSGSDPVAAPARQRPQMQPAPPAHDEIVATCFELFIRARSWHFAHLVHLIEELVLTGQSIYPVERTLLTTGILDAAMSSHHEGGQRLETPHLDVRYQPVRLGQTERSAG
jgi:hypothetical protein